MSLNPSKKTRKLVWWDSDQSKTAYSTTNPPFTITGSFIIFHGDNGDVLLSPQMKFVIL